MMTATCSGEVLCIIKSIGKKRERCSAFPIHANDRLHVIEVTLERAAPGRREAEFRPRRAPFESLLADEVLGVLELSRVDAEVAVRCVEETLEIRERQEFVRRERADDAEAHAFMNELLQLR